MLFIKRLLCRQFCHKKKILTSFLELLVAVGGTTLPRPNMEPYYQTVHVEKCPLPSVLCIYLRSDNTWSSGCGSGKGICTCTKMHNILSESLVDDGKNTWRMISCDRFNWETTVGRKDMLGHVTTLSGTDGDKNC